MRTNMFVSNFFPPKCEKGVTSENWNRKTKCTLRETSTTSASWTSRTTSTWKTRTTSSAIGHLWSLKQGSAWQRGSEHIGQLAVGEGALQAQHSILWDFVGLHIFNSQSSEILRGYDNYTIISGNPRTFSKQISDSNFLKLALRAKNEAYTVSQGRSQPIITCNRDFFAWTLLSQP